MSHRTCAVCGEIEGRDATEYELQFRITPVRFIKKYEDNGKWAGKHICTRCDAKNRARILTPVQAYKVAINALNTFERKWDVYVKEQARLLSVFDEDEE